MIQCDAVGRTVRHDGTGVRIPQPGQGVSIDVLSPAGEGIPAHSFGVTVSRQGIIRYDY